MKKRIQKGLVLALCLLLAGTVFPQMVFAADRTPPKVSTLKLNTHEVKPGDTIKISCKATDDSEITELVLNFRNGDYYTQNISLVKTSSGAYAGKYKVPKTLVNGMYSLGYFSVQDKAGNKYQTYDPNDFPGMYFMVTNGSKDKTPPKIRSISFDKKTVAPGDLVTVTLKISDSSGINTDLSESYLYLSNKGHLSEPFVFENKGSGVFTASQLIPNTYINGLYSISEIVLTDKAGNVFIGGSSYAKFGFTVKKASKDRKAPEILKVALNKTSLKAGDTLKVSLKVADDSAISLERLDTYLVFKCGGYRSKVIAFKDAGNGVISGKLKIDSSFLNGTYTIDILRVSDVLGNSLTENKASAYPKLKFKVTGNAKSKKTGWVSAGGKKYYYKNGVPQKGWLQYGGNWYYLKSDGEMVVSRWIKVDGKYYYLKSNGVMATGWLKYNGNKYYLDSNGARVTGWKQIGNYWYFFKPNGVMASNEWYGGYWLSKNGAWTYQAYGSWRKDSVGKWFGDSYGWYAKNGTYRIDGKEYKFNSAGYLVK